ncbi:hypothetical protein FQY83_14565 [Luteimonas marina]|uniref:Uncharacterized protein n=1 Tax=Luteimonas marina TaxID=488485 RepID=A0A5C5TXX8_9GAMM|nr:hypothetical protein [Luteimonas marina]TWT18596.1 hypothetical protein FQY83_14565 [Luteimonas marina]
MSAVIPAQAGIHFASSWSIFPRKINGKMDDQRFALLQSTSGFRRDDDPGSCSGLPQDKTPVHFPLQL